MHFRMVGDLICRIKGGDLGVDWVQNRGKSGKVGGRWVDRSELCFNMHFEIDLYVSLESRVFADR